MMLTACGPDGVPLVSHANTPPPTSTPAANRPPAIAGSPAVNASASTNYSFIPSVSDLDGDALSFSISGKPAWATFSVSTGALTGTAQAGIYANIVISVTDGKATVALPAFSINVSALPTPGTAALSWIAPTQNTDGSPLPASELAGYRIYQGTSAQGLLPVQMVNGASSTSFTVTQLLPGTHYFAVSAVTVTGVESALSAVGSKTIL